MPASALSLSGAKQVDSHVLLRGFGSGMIFSRSAYLLSEASAPLPHFVYPCCLWGILGQSLHIHCITSPFRALTAFRASRRKGHGMRTLSELCSEGLKRWGVVSDAESVHLTGEHTLACQLGDKGLQLLSRACTAEACSREACTP